MFNGHPAHLVSTSQGATAGSVELVGNGIVGRGVLVDVPMIRDVPWVERGEGVTPDDIRAAARRCGFEVEEGDLLLVRTGRIHRRNVEGPVAVEVVGSPACHAACLPLFHQRGIALLGSDTGNDVEPPPYSAVTHPIHEVGIAAMGLWILDNANLEELALECRKRERWEFMLSIQPLKLQNTTGSPVSPLAFF
jgi:kynurenine formamidase